MNTVDYNHEIHGKFAQYDRRQAGYYRGGKKSRVAREVAAHQAGVRQAEKFECPNAVRAYKLSKGKLL